jgi:tRNA_anti-like
MKALKIILVLAIIAALGGYYVYNKPVSGLEDTKPAFTMSSDELFTAFETDETAANKKFLGKVIEVSGTVQSVNHEQDGNTSVTLQTAGGMFGVICRLDSLNSSPQGITNGQKVSMKGECSGMLMDVVLVRCINIKK